MLSPLSVVPELHGRGLGTELLAAAVGGGARARLPRRCSWRATPGFYSRRGFEPATPRGFVRPSPRIPEAAFQVVVLDAHEPWMTGALVYCDPFWVHDCVGLRDPRLANFDAGSP